MKLYYMPGACSLGVHIVLEWIGAPYEVQRLSHDELKQAPFLAVNPAGAVPALAVDGWVLTQNAAILNYLADSFPEAKLGGDGSPKSRAEINRWLGVINADAHPAFRPLFGATSYLNDKAAIEATKANAKTRVRQYLQTINNQLEGRDWLASQRSIADPYLFVITRWCEAMEIDLAGLDHVHRFRERMNADPAVQNVLSAEGLS
ncbi:MAG TPA: glutathione binding-like protein [Marinobacter sp.]|nr:glutathione binding-like protein [Marinobacter sp.]